MELKLSRGRFPWETASQEEMERMVAWAWNNQDYVLDSGDFTSVDFKTVGRT